MNPTTDLKGEHTAILIILEAMKKMALDIRKGRFIDSYRIVQIIDFLHTFNENCHFEKEEKKLFPALIDCNIPWTLDIINHLVTENERARIYIKDIDNKFEEYLSGDTQILDSLCVSMIQYVEIEEYHIRIVDNVILPLCERIFDKQMMQTLSSEFKNIQNRNAGSFKKPDYYKLMSMLNVEDAIHSEIVYY